MCCQNKQCYDSCPSAMYVKWMWRIYFATLFSSSFMYKIQEGWVAGWRLPSYWSPLWFCIITIISSYRKMGLWTLLEGCLLLANALAILNEDRFLAHRGLSFSEFSGGKTKSFKGQLIGLIYATQYLRVPLILLNFICIFVKLVSGWHHTR